MKTDEKNNTLTRQLCTRVSVHEQGSRGGAVVRTLISHQCGPGAIPGTQRHMWVEFVVSSCPCSEGFSPGSPVFLPPQKLTFLNSN